MNCWSFNNNELKWSSLAKFNCKGYQITKGHWKTYNKTIIIITSCLLALNKLLLLCTMCLAIFEEKIDSLGWVWENK